MTRSDGSSHLARLTPLKAPSSRLYGLASEDDENWEVERRLVDW